MVLEFGSIMSKCSRRLEALLGIDSLASFPDLTCKSEREPDPATEGRKIDLAEDNAVVDVDGDALVTRPRTRGGSRRLTTALEIGPRVVRRMFRLTDFGIDGFRARGLISLVYRSSSESSRSIIIFLFPNSKGPSILLFLPSNCVFEVVDILDISILALILESRVIYSSRSACKVGGNLG